MDSNGTSEPLLGETTSTDNEDTHNFHTTHEEEDELRKHLKYFFMNPCEKFSAKRKFPWKLTAQLIKIVLVTIQLALFGFARSGHVDFLEKSNTAFHHLYLRKWDPSFETMPYPPATGAFAIYTIPEFYDDVNYALSRYNQTEEIAIGTYHFNHPNDTMPPVRLCKVHYKRGNIYAFNHSFVFDAKTVKECFELHPVKDNTTHKEVYDTKKYLDSINSSLNFDRIIRLELKFAVATVHLKEMTKVSTPDCYVFNITITFENHQHNGQMLIDLTSVANPVQCHGTIEYDNDTETVVAVYVIFDVIVLLLCILSTVLCIRSIINAQHLRKDTTEYFKTRLSVNLSLEDKLEFINLWYVMIIVNDLMIIVGSVFKIRVELKEYHNYEECGLLLGTGNLLVWFGVLRYLKFFDAYNILILTMRKSAPNIFRFLVCASVFYFGFTVCGWVVLGPYHIKFRTISTTSECLFSLVNGDDMFVTFSVIKDTKHTPLYVWYFARIYLYTFISMFIYVVLNLFIAVILDTYEVLKFLSVSSSSECLFSLMNGDDMFVTFQAVRSSGFVWWYSRIFLYLFISIFIYIVLSIFLTVIKDTFDSIKFYHENGFPKTYLHTFIDKPLNEDTFRNHHTNSCCAVASFMCLSQCCHRQNVQDLSVQADDVQPSLVT